MAKRFVLTCLGQPELRTAEGKVVRIRVKKHLGLLVFLAVERRQSHTRGRLVELFWGRAAPARGRHSCATALSVLRSIFGKTAFTATRELVRFHPADLTLDLDPLEKGEIIGPDGEAVIDVDGFLRGFELDDCPEWSLWKEREHSHRMPSIHAGLLTLIDHGRRRGSHEEIMRQAERLLALDHLAEEGIRAKMEALALVGDRFSALRVFDEWKEQLAGELQAEPSGLVDGMASQLRKRGWEPKEPNPVPAVPAEQWRDRKFVGRRAEYRVLYETWEAVHQFEPRYFLISGDSGVGKTTLAQRLVTAAGMEGASVSRVQCYEMEQRIPFAAIGGLVTGLLGRPGLAATSPDALAEVGRLVPGIKAHFPHLPPPKQGERESARLLFAEGVLDLLTAVMEERPLLLVVDDIHNADEASLAVLHLVMRRLPKGRGLIAMTARVDAILGTAAERFMEPGGQLQIGRLTLGVMPDDESHELLDLLLDRTRQLPTRTEKRALVGASRGFPMVLELLAQDWAVNGTRSAALALRAITVDLRLAPPRGNDPFARLVDRLLIEISPSARQVLSVAAVLGNRLNDLRLYAIADLGFRAVMDGLSELVGRRVLRDIAGSLEFPNELLRAHAYRSVPQAILVALHSEAADRLLAQPGSEPSKAPHLEIAWHLMRAQRTEEAARSLLAGAKGALLNGAPDEVVLCLQSSINDLSEPSRTQARALLASAMHELGRWDSGLALVAPLESDASNPIFRVLAVEARWRLNLLTSKGMEEAVQSLLDLAGPQAPAATEALVTASFIAGALRDEDLIDRVQLQIPEEPQSDTLKDCELLIASAALAFYRRRLDQGEAAAAKARGILTRLGATNSSALRLEIGIGCLRLARGDYLAGYRHLMFAADLCRRLDNDSYGQVVSGNASVVSLRLGEYSRAIRHAREVTSLTELTAASLATYGECCSLALSGRAPAAILRLEEAKEKVDWTRHAWLAQMAALFEADVYLLCGQKSKARRSAREATGDNTAPILSRGATGAFVRWGCRLALTEGIKGTFAETLESLLIDRQNLDAIDRYELARATLKVGAAGWIARHTAVADEEQVLRSTLPSAALDQIERTS